MRSKDEGISLSIRGHVAYCCTMVGMIKSGVVHLAETMFIHVHVFNLPYLVSTGDAHVGIELILERTLRPRLHNIYSDNMHVCWCNTSCIKWYGQ